MSWKGKIDRTNHGLKKPEEGSAGVWSLRDTVPFHFGHNVRIQRRAAVWRARWNDLLGASSIKDCQNGSYATN